MKLNPTSVPDLNMVTGYGPGYVAVNRRRYAANLVVMPGRIEESWAPAGFEALTEDDFCALRDLRPEIVLLGTGSRQRFPAPRLLRPLIEAGIGCEVMDLPAACRTYSVLAGEGRLVAAALLID